MAHWLLKSEPDAFSIDDLRKAKTTIWDGVRNFQARNYMLSAEVGDLAFFYHSNAKPPGIVGLCKVIKTRVVDPSQFDETSHYYDPKSTKAAPTWHTLKVQFVEKFPNYLSLDELRETFSPDDLIILRKGSRLSVTPVPDSTASQLIELGRGSPAR
ncbi:MAG TPA: EVE domain-containing protein [Ilumatobacteraceae bacterium]